MKFDAFVRRADKEFPEAKKVFAHPFIANPEAQLKKHNFNSNVNSQNYNYGVVGKISVIRDKLNELYFFSPYDKQQDMVKVERDIIADILSNNGTILIYSSKASLLRGDYLERFKKYLKYCPNIKEEKALKYIEELRDYIGAGNSKDNKKHSVLVSLMKRGIVLHHGSMPLKMRFIIEQFVRDGFVKVCFATSTLNQGINMPFDAVYIDNFRNVPTLMLKNLIGRAGRTTKKEQFDYGYTIINQRNIATYTQRIQESVKIKEKSNLDDSIDLVDEDEKDLVEAIQEDAFNDELQITHKQEERLKNNDAYSKVLYILDNLFIESRIMTTNEYYKLNNTVRKNIKAYFGEIYVKQLRRNELSLAEKTIISTAIPIILWKIQGKSFKEILGYRYAYLTKQSEQKEIRVKVKKGEISSEEAERIISEMKIKYSQVPSQLPNKAATKHALFPNKKLDSFDYDTLVFDTYDYLDKVISLSLCDPISAAFRLYYEETEDNRSLIMCNYLRYGTNDEKEIWLLRYGFSFEDIEWIKEYVSKIDEKEIVFNEGINSLSDDKKEVIKKYL